MLPNKTISKRRFRDFNMVNNNLVKDGCIFCHHNTFFIDQVCSDCRSVFPDHIPSEQVKRYLMRIKKGKQNA